MSKLGEQRRQGDVYFTKVAEVPEGAKLDEKGVIAEGEVTGHLHQIKPGSKSELFILNEDMFVEAKDEGVCEVIHPEHNTVHLGPGSWKVTRQREFISQSWARVAD